ncbi:MAG: NAD(P)/FAD-dependent oxidoreductase [Tagaea sp.]
MSARALVAVVGAGPAGLFAAETLALGGARAVVFDRMAAPLRKFLLAGRGGLNLTHSEPHDAFSARYAAARGSLAPALAAFPPQALRGWADGLGAETFVGSSGRVFPRAMKASPLARAWLKRLDGLGVELRARHRWTGWTADGALRFETPAGGVDFRCDAAILALGGASWPKLGADGGWVETLRAAGAAVVPLAPSNCGFCTEWSAHLCERHAGAPLKRIALAFEGRRARGEATLTRTGIEGGAVYALSGPLRDAIARDGHAILRVDLAPDMPETELAGRLGAPRGSKSFATWLKRAVTLSPAAMGLLREDPDVASLAPASLAARIKAVPIRLTGTAGIERAISTAGGVAFDGVTEDIMLRARPGVFVAGEMLDWEAPTGGYLLQACFATGRAAARGALAFLARSGPG